MSTFILLYKKILLVFQKLTVIVLGCLFIHSCSNSSETEQAQKTISEDLASYFKVESVLETYRLNLPNLSDSNSIYSFSSRTTGSNQDLMIWLAYTKQTNDLYFCIPNIMGIDFQPYVADSVAQMILNSHELNTESPFNSNKKIWYVYADQDINYTIFDDLFSKLNYFTPTSGSTPSIQLVNSIKDKQTFIKLRSTRIMNPLYGKIRQKLLKLENIPAAPPPPPMILPIWYHTLTQSDQVITLKINGNGSLIIDDNKVIDQTELFETLQQHKKVQKFHQRIHEEHLGTIYQPPNNPIIYIKFDDNTKLKDFVAVQATISKINEVYWARVQNAYPEEFASMEKYLIRRIWQANAMVVFRHNKLEYQYLKAMETEGKLEDFWKDNYVYSANR
ncbi:MAG: hypothetical protein MK212_16550 [Saprospiraceae bacterium]|nr:hypothetical protein [Saprospiraceae bacterium]